MSSTRKPTVELKSNVDVLLSNSVSASTKLTYKTGFQTFVSYLLLQGIIYRSTELPTLTEDLLLSFVAYCFHELKLQYSTIKLYLCGIRHNYLVLTKDNVFETSTLPRLQAALTGVKRIQGLQSKSKKPITIEILVKLIHRLAIGFIDPYTDLLFIAVMTVAFFGFLRCGEFTVRHEYDESLHVSLKDVVIHGDRICLTLKQSKNDPFRKGVTITLYSTANVICPKLATVKYLKARNIKFTSKRRGSDPLFLMHNGQALTRSYFINKLRCILKSVGLDDKLYSGHSFRRGAASTCGSANVPDYLIQYLGRWKSNCHIRYIDVPDSVIRDTHIAMGKQTDN